MPLALLQGQAEAEVAELATRWGALLGGSSRLQARAVQGEGEGLRSGGVQWAPHVAQC